MIPFCKTTLGEEEKKAVNNVIDSGWVVMGEKTKQFEEEFASYVGSKYAVFVDSGTSALFLAMKWHKEHFLPQNAPGAINEPIIVPSITFTATAESAIHAGFDIKFGDVSREDLCLKEVDLMSLPVHLTGNKAKMGAFVYDSAHRIEKDDLKRTSALYCYSFYATKNMSTVQGGMVACNDLGTYNWLKMARDHGLDLGTKERYKGRYKQYDVKFIGWRVKPDDMRAAVGLEQLKKLPQMTERRNEIVEMYNKAFGTNRKGNHLYYLYVNNRPKFIDAMFNDGIQTVVHFRPLHEMTGYSSYVKRLSKPLTDTHWIGRKIVSLPLYPTMTDDEVKHVIKSAQDTGLCIDME